jgi:hypothetical protein
MCAPSSAWTSRAFFTPHCAARSAMSRVNSFGNIRTLEEARGIPAIRHVEMHGIRESGSSIRCRHSFLLLERDKEAETDLYGA